jgi:hypothetical protein
MLPDDPFKALSRMQKETGEALQRQMDEMTSRLVAGLRDPSEGLRQIIQMQKQLSIETAAKLSDFVAKSAETYRDLFKDFIDVQRDTAVVLAQIREDLTNLSSRLDDLERRRARRSSPAPRRRRGPPQG